MDRVALAVQKDSVLFCRRDRKFLWRRDTFLEVRKIVEIFWILINEIKEKIYIYINFINFLCYIVNFIFKNFFYIIVSYIKG